MRYPAMHATTFYFGTDGTGSAAVIGSMAGVLCDVSLVFFVLLLHLKCLADFYLNPVYSLQKCCGKRVCQQ